MALRGAKAIEKNLDKSLNIMSNTLEESLIEVGERAVGILRENTPVVEGRLRNSMSYTIAGKVYDPLNAEQTGDKVNKSSKKDRVIIGTNVVYAPSVEYMASNGSAGFMLRSYKLLIPIAKKIVGDIIKRSFK